MVDEAQGFADAWWEALQPCLRDPSERVLFVFADEHQSVVDREGREPGQIALLTTGSRHPVQKEQVELEGYDGYWDGFFSSSDVFYGHVLGFKGLERPVVVLAVNGFGSAERAQQRLYVGLSRARSLLMVVGDGGEIWDAGGPEVRERISAGS